MFDFFVNLMALAGIALIVTGFALVSIPAALIAGGVALLGLAFAIVRLYEHRKRTN